MSRLYRLDIETSEPLLPDTYYHLITQELNGDAPETSEFNSRHYLSVDNTLCGGEREEEAHARISAAIKQRQPNCKVMTRWTCLENPPYDEFGDNMEETQ